MNWRNWRNWLRRSRQEWLWTIRRRIHPNRAYNVRFDGDLTIQVCLKDELSLRYALQQDYEPDVCAFFRDFLRPGMVVIDLGANIGHFTLLAAKRVRPTGRVHAFEPAPEEYSKLCGNVVVNGFENVTVLQHAVCDRDGSVSLQTCANGLGLYNSIGRPIRDTEIFCVSVPSTTLDTYVSTAKIDRVHLIKMDVEGAELGVIRGAERLLSADDAPILVCEFNDAAAAGIGHSTRDLRRAIEDLGYSLYRYDWQTRRLEPEPVRGQYDYANLICCKGRLPF